MNTQKNWNSDDTLPTKITIDDLRKLKPSGSIHPLNKLRQIMKQQIYAGFIVLSVFLTLIILFNQLLFTSLLIPICLYLAYFLFRSFKIFQNMNRINDQPNENILEKIKWQYQVIKKYVRTSETLAVFLYPLSILAGMVITVLIIEGKKPANLFNDPYFIYVSIAAIVLFVPIQYFFTKKINKKTFGSHLEHLKDMTEKLENEE